MSFMTTERGTIPGKVTHNHVHRSFSIILSQVRVTPNLKIEAWRSNPKQVSIIHVSHIQGHRTRFPTPPKKGGETNPNMRPTFSQATLVLPRVLLPATELPST